MKHRFVKAFSGGCRHLVYRPSECRPPIHSTRFATLALIAFLVTCDAALGDVSPGTRATTSAPGTATTASAQGVTAEPLLTVDTPLPAPVELPAPPQPLPADMPASALTADQAAAVALNHQPTIAEAAGQATSASGVTQQARSGLLPSIDLSAGISNAHVLTGGGSSFSASGVDSTPSGQASNTTLSLRQLLFDGGHTNALVNQSKYLEGAANATLTQTQLDTVLNVKQAFYTYVQDERLVSVNEANYHSQVDHLAVARAQQQAGIGLPADVVKAQTTVSEAALQVGVARNAASVARVNLALAMGLDPRAPITPADSDEPEPASSDLNAMVTKAMANRPEAIAVADNVKAAQAAVTAARTVNAPVIQGVIGLPTKGTGIPQDTASIAVGAALTWTPFDSGYTAGHVKEAKGQLTTDEAQLAAVRLNVTSDVSQAYLNEKLAAQRVGQANDEVTNAQVSVDLATGRYRAGIGVFLDVTDAQQALLTAQTDRVNAQSALDQARAALAHAIGQPA